MGHDKQWRRAHIEVRGAVQGVGFRPFVYRLASELDLTGWVNNSVQGVLIEVEGPLERLERFLERLRAEKPPQARIQEIESEWRDPAGSDAFTIQESDTVGDKIAFVLPDIATCRDCLREIFDPDDRRHRYPFANCTNCGPRFTIIEALPYDRPNTTMQVFAMCARCRKEYEDPFNRRFHAQPNACPACGPQLELWGPEGHVLGERDEALHQAAAALRDGKIVAVKGLGGFHLMADARNDRSVRELRRRKDREEKPLALMAPSLELVRALCEISELEEQWLTSPEAPIVLLERKQRAADEITPSVAPGNPYWGFMLPYTPLHHLLMAELGFPAVATSGNLSDEPICTDEQEALERLGGVADSFLVHNRPIARHVDDSVVRVMAGRPVMLRRARGYAPLPVRLAERPPPTLAVGAHLKSSIAVSVEGNAFISQHIGDLETAQARDTFEKAVGDFHKLYGLEPQIIACDAHPDYVSTRYAEALGKPLIRVQHHHAHMLSCVAEHDLKAPILGVTWDGTGYGGDGTVWGGEFLTVSDAGYERVAHLERFRLAGGEQSVKEPRRTALGLLYQLYGGRAFEMDELPPLQACSAEELTVLRQMLERGLNAPRTSSAGRLFDAVGSLVGLRQRATFEGQAAMELEFAVDTDHDQDQYPFAIMRSNGKDSFIVDWGPMIEAILEDLKGSVPVGKIAACFHGTLVEMIVSVACKLEIPVITLTGGCFQNRYLTERAVRRLSDEGFQAYVHQQVPPNDGGVALGQILAAARASRTEG